MYSAKLPHESTPLLKMVSQDIRTLLLWLLSPDFFTALLKQCNMLLFLCYFEGHSYFHSLNILSLQFSEKQGGCSKRKSNDKTWNCKQHGKRFLLNQLLRAHNLVVHKVNGRPSYKLSRKRYSVPKLNRKSAHEEELHIEFSEIPVDQGCLSQYNHAHIEEALLDRNQCKKEFSQKQEHITVAKSVANERREWFSQTQDQEKDGLVPTREPPFVCNRCCTRFHEKQNQVTNIGICASAQSNLCNDCGKGLIEEHNLFNFQICKAEGPFVCEKHCGKSFSKKQNLVEHYRLLKEGKRFACDQCGKKFTKKRSLIDHFCSHKGEQLFACDQCGKKFTQKGVLKAHSRLHTGERPFACDQCGKKFTQKGNLTVHSRLHKGDRPFACDQCGKKFTQKQTLIVHSRLHSKEQPYVCNECGKGFSHKQDLHRHNFVHTGEFSQKQEHSTAPKSVANEHREWFSQTQDQEKDGLVPTREPPFVCNRCCTRFHEKQNQVTNIGICASAQSDLCNDCGKELVEKHSLFNIQICKAEGPFVCEKHCGKSFSKQRYLMEHYRSLIEGKRFACDNCGKKFTKERSLRDHFCSHKGERPFTCDQCGKKFTQKGHLTVHSRLHTGDRPFACDQCGKKFTQKQTLIVHSRLHTKE